jgi:inosine-uridine nucleoside N-ribohydrolase
MKRIRLFLVFLILGIGFISLNAKMVSSEKLVILDTDIGSDYDDVGALAILHALADKEEAKILATISSNRYKNSVPCIEIINTYYHRSSIPIAKPSKGLDIQDPRFLGKIDYWAEKLPAEYSHKFASSMNAPDAVPLYRKILSEQLDSSVTIISIGFFTNLAALLESCPDQWSSLNGKDLVAKKVKKLVSMAGSFPLGKEFNVYSDVQASKIVFEKWPTPLLLCGFEIGNSIYTGKALQNSRMKNNPVKEVYSICMKTDMQGRPSWDPITILFAVRDSKKYFDTEKGEMLVFDDGRDQWIQDPLGPHERILMKKSPKKLRKILENLMIHLPSV